VWGGRDQTSLSDIVGLRYIPEYVDGAAHDQLLAAVAGERIRVLVERVAMIERPVAIPRYQVAIPRCQVAIAVRLSADSDGCVASTGAEVADARLLVGPARSRCSLVGPEIAKGGVAVTVIVKQVAVDLIFVAGRRRQVRDCGQCVAASECDG